MTLEEIRRQLRESIEKEGGVSKWSKKHKICKGYIYESVKNNNSIGPKILKALGKKKVIEYERVGYCFKIHIKFEDLTK